MEDQWEDFVMRELLQFQQRWTGLGTLATPDGRNAGSTTCEGCSPSPQWLLMDWQYLSQYLRPTEDITGGIIKSRLHGPSF